MVKQLREYTRAQAQHYRTHIRWLDYVLVETMLSTGMRPGEIAATNSQPDRYLRLRQLFLDGDDPLIYVEQAKHDSARNILIPRQHAKLLAAYLNAYRPEAGPDDPVFCGRMSGAALTYDTMRRILARLGRDIKYCNRFGAREVIRPHMMRHTYAVLLYRATRNLLLLKQQLGHTSLKTTMIYMSVLEEDARRDVERLTTPDGTFHLEAEDLP